MQILKQIARMDFIKNISVNKINVSGTSASICVMADWEKKIFHSIEKMNLVKFSPLERFELSH